MNRDRSASCYCKTSLKAQQDDLVAKKSELKAKADGLVDEVVRLKSESTKA
jgi:hypothetical protein